MTPKEYISIEHITALILVIYGILYTFNAKGEDIWYVFDILGGLTMILGGSSLLLIIRPNIYTSAAILGGTIGLSLTLTFAHMIMSTYLLGFMLGCTIIVCGILSVLFSFSLYCGNKYSVQRMRIVLIIYMGIILLYIIANVAFGDTDLFKELLEMKENLITFAIIILYFIILNNPEIKYHTLKGRVNNNANTISNIVFNDPNAYIKRDDLLNVTDVDKWEKVNEGPIVSETVLPLTINGKTAMFVSHLWNDGRFIAEIVRSNAGTKIQSLRFEVKYIVLDNNDPYTCKKVTIYGNDGFFITLLVNDQQTKLKKMTKGVRFVYRLMGY